MNNKISAEEGRKDEGIKRQAELKEAFEKAKSLAGKHISNFNDDELSDLLIYICLVLGISDNEGKIKTLSTNLRNTR